VTSWREISRSTKSIRRDILPKLQHLLVRIMAEVLGVSGSMHRRSDSERFSGISDIGKLTSTIVNKTAI
jgi:hypothetical protein